MLARTSKCIGRAFWAPANQISNAATHAKTTALPRKPGQAAASISYPVEFAMNSSRVWQTIADGARPCADKATRDDPAFARSKIR
jgi:hypothetical protein